MTRSQPEWKSTSQRAKSMRKRNLIAYHASEYNLFYHLECSCGTSHQASDHQTHILDERPHSILASSLLPINGKSSVTPPLCTLQNGGKKRSANHKPKRSRRYSGEVMTSNHFSL